MDFLRRLFSGGGQPKDGGMYYYVRNRRSGEVVQIRLDINQLSPQIESGKVAGYFTRKVVVGTKSFERMEAEFTFDSNRRLVEKTVTDAEFVEQDVWLAQQSAAEDLAAAEHSAVEESSSEADE